MTAPSRTRNMHRASALKRLADAIALAFCKLHQIQFDAPWNPRREGC